MKLPLLFSNGVNRLALQDVIVIPEAPSAVFQSFSVVPFSRKSSVLMEVAPDAFFPTVGVHPL